MHHSDGGAHVKYMSPPPPPVAPQGRAALCVCFYFSQQKKFYCDSTDLCFKSNSRVCSSSLSAEGAIPQHSRSQSRFPRDLNFDVNEGTVESGWRNEFAILNLYYIVHIPKVT